MLVERNLVISDSRSRRYDVLESSGRMTKGEVRSRKERNNFLHLYTIVVAKMVQLKAREVANEFWSTFKAGRNCFQIYEEEWSLLGRG